MEVRVKVDHMNGLITITNIALFEGVPLLTRQSKSECAVVG